MKASMESSKLKNKQIPLHIKDYLLPGWLNNIVDFETLPILDIGKKQGWTDYIDFITVEDVTAPVMRGVDIHGRPFITLRIIDRNTNVKSVHTIFQRYTDCKEAWRCGTRSQQIILNTCLDTRELEFLDRLFKHKPCNVYSCMQGAEESPKCTKDGYPFVELI